MPGDGHQSGGRHASWGHDSQPGGAGSFAQHHNDPEYARAEVEDVYVGSRRQAAGYDNQELGGGAFVDDASEGSEESDMGHTRLYVIVEEGMPRPNESRQQRKEILDQTWERVRKWLWAHQDPEERAAAATVRGNNDATALHNVCKLSNPPTDIVQALLEAAIETVTWADVHGWLPLHHACANGASGVVLQILADAYPEGKTKQDSQNRTPLHFYLTQKTDNSNSMANNIVFLANSGASELPDVGGMLPMHYACAYGVSPAVLQVLMDAYPDSLIAKENKGRTPMHLAMVNAHRDASPGVINFLLANAGSELVNLRDHDGYLPLHLLALGLKGFKAEESEQRNNVSECLKMYLAAEPTASADFLTALQDLPDWLQDVAVVSPHVRNILNKKIVQRAPTCILMLDGYFLILIIICFEFASTSHIDVLFGESGAETNLVALGFLFLGGLYFLTREVVQIVSLWSLGSVSSWFYDPNNWLDMTVITLVFYYAIIMTSVGLEVSPEMFRSGVAFTKGVLWAAVIYFLKATLVDFAVFVGGVFYVLQRLAAFLMAVGVILLAFAQMFFIIYTDTDICGYYPDPYPDPDKQGKSICDFPHCEFGRSLLKVYTMMMGEINGEARYETQLVAQILYVAYAFLVVILLSNVLIAIVTDSYEIIQNDRAAIVFWSNRLDFIAEMDAISYGIRQKLSSISGDSGGATGAPSQVQESPYSSGIHTNGGPKGQKRYFYEGWKNIVQLFDQNLYDDIALSPQNIEFWCYFFFQGAAVVFVIPLWILAGILTAGILWPPQIREYLFVQKETAISRADLEKQKLQQLKEIQISMKVLKSDLKKEMASDREEMIRMKNEVETIQNDVMADLQQVRELMTTLLDMGRQRVGR
jgi:ankyrin repeat protein